MPSRLRVSSGGRRISRPTRGRLARSRPAARTARAICSSSAWAATFSWCAKEPERGTAAFPSGGITREGATMAAPLTATAINCSLSTGGRESSTDAMLAVLADHFKEQGVTVADPIRIAAHDIKWGVKSDEGEGDEWPAIREKILAADILIFGPPIWMGQIGRAHV